MLNSRLNGTSRRWFAGAALLVIAARSLIPAGFMPSADRPFTLEICPDGFPVRLLPAASQHSRHEHGNAGSHGSESSGGSHDHGSWQSGHCVFAGVASTPPVHDSGFEFGIVVPVWLALDPKSESFTSFRCHTPNPRAPPLLA
jgi:hypothetical protein